MSEKYNNPFEEGKEENFPPLFPHHHPHFKDPTIEEEYRKTVALVTENVKRVLNLETHIRETFDKLSKDITADNVAFKNLSMETYNRFALGVFNDITTFKSAITNSYELSKAELQLAYDRFTESINQRVAEMNDYFITNFGEVVYSQILRAINNGEMLDIFNEETMQKLGESVNGVYDFNKYLVYQGANSLVEISPEANGGLNVSFTGLLSFKLQNFVGTKTWEEIGEKLGDAITINGNNAVVRVGMYQALVFNTDEMKLKLVTESEHLNSFRAHDYILLRNTWSNAVGGELLEITLRNRLSALENLVEVKTPLLSVMNGFAYITNSGVISYAYRDDGGIDLSFNKKLAFRFADTNTTYTWEELTEHVTATTDGDSAIIKVPVYNALVFNITEQKLRYRSTVSKITKDDFVLVQLAYGKIIGGYLYSSYLAGQLDEMSETLKNISFSGNSSTFTIPDSVKRFSALSATASENTESFIFFTDPHLCEGTEWRAQFDAYIGYLKNVFDSAPVSYVICGGDWLGNSDTTADACMKLGYIDGQMRKAFGDKYMLVVGNHDTNYQGEAILSYNAMSSLWFRNDGKTYYTRETRTTKFIILDTVSDWTQYQDNAYFAEQLNFLARELMNTDKHIIILYHMYTTDGATVHPLSSKVNEMCKAYNTKKTFAGLGVTANFANAKGSAELILSGHEHNDGVISIADIPPVVKSVDMRKGGKPTFDICFVDYDKNKATLIREGTGSDRTVTLATNSPEAPESGDDEGGSGDVTPPEGGDDEGGSGDVTPPESGDDEGGSDTPPVGFPELGEGEEESIPDYPELIIFAYEGERFYTVRGITWRDFIASEDNPTVNDEGARKFIIYNYEGVDVVAVYKESANAYVYLSDVDGSQYGVSPDAIIEHYHIYGNVYADGETGDGGNDPDDG